MDNVTQQRIELLHPRLRTEITDLINKCNGVLTQHSQVRITQGLRTIEEQNDLYAQGRTKAGHIVTNAKGGSSFHNYGLALDFCLMIDNKEASFDERKDYDLDGQSDWMEVVKIFKSGGYEWGGDWHTIKDTPHFQKVFGYSWQELYKKYSTKDFIKGTEYVTL